jgi:hypothetical protein
MEVFDISDVAALGSTIRELAALRARVTQRIER